ncbi:immunity repressor [Gordonia phage Ecliptus]|nr:immunity repressor [Gordonia phage Ecliptus]
MSKLWEFVQAHLDRTGASEAAFARQIGSIPQTVNSWKKRGLRQLPEVDTLRAISELTGVAYTDVISAVLTDIGYIEDGELPTKAITPNDHRQIALAAHLLVEAIPNIDELDIPFEDVFTFVGLVEQSAGLLGRTGLQKVDEETAQEIVVEARKAASKYRRLARRVAASLTGDDQSADSRHGDLEEQDDVTTEPTTTGRQGEAPPRQKTGAAQRRTRKADNLTSPDQDDSADDYDLVGRDTGGPGEAELIRRRMDEEAERGDM